MLGTGGMGAKVSDWDKIGAQVAKIGAPLLGGLLGGPAGAAGGSAIAAIIASALGVEPDVGEIERAIATDPQAAMKLKEAQMRHVEELEKLSISAENMRIAAETHDLEQVNRTMRAELANGNWYQKGWRPTWGYLSAGAFAAQMAAISYLLINNGDPQLISAIGSLTTIWSVALAVVGVTSHRRSTDKQTLSQIPQTGGILDAVAHRIRGANND